MKNLTLLTLISLVVTVSMAQESTSTFNYSLHGFYNTSTDDYSTNLTIDTAANIVVYVNADKTNITVTSENDTLLSHDIYDTEKDEDLLIQNTTNYLVEAVFLSKRGEGVTMLYDFVDDISNPVNSHYKEKYFWSNK